MRNKVTQLYNIAPSEGSIVQVGELVLVWKNGEWKSLHEVLGGICTSCRGEMVFLARKSRFVCRSCEWAPVSADSKCRLSFRSVFAFLPLYTATVVWLARFLS